MKSTGLKNRPKLRQMFKKFEGKATVYDSTTENA